MRHEECSSFDTKTSSKYQQGKQSLIDLEICNFQVVFSGIHLRMQNEFLDFLSALKFKIDLKQEVKYNFFSSTAREFKCIVDYKKKVQNVVYKTIESFSITFLACQPTL